MGEGPAGGDALGALRREIDRIDAAMHGLLMERGAIIDRLIATKGTAASGSAFRPERESAMMRMLAGRHAGLLPIDAVEAIWRVIISTFTFVQAPFRVHADASLGEAGLRDTARFHFGFTVPLDVQPGPAEVVGAVAASRGDLGLVHLGPAETPWWQALEPDDAPKVIARLPIAPRPDHPAGTPALILSRAPSGEGPGAVAVYSARLSGTRPVDAVTGGAEILATAGDAALLALPRGHDPDEAGRRLGAARLVPVGSHPEPVRLPAATVSRLPGPDAPAA